MNRSDFIKTLALGAAAMKLDTLRKLSDSLTATDRMPVLFLGHGNPMNAISDNTFTQGFIRAGKELPKPKAILCVSAHWETRGTFVTAMEKPETIHDFGSFPQALFDVQYPAPGSPELAAEAKSLVKSTTVNLTDDWGLDHGCWTVVKFLYPDADIPVIQMSIDYTKPAAFHYELGKELSALRRKGVLIVGSGNTVHNLGMVAWNQMSTLGFGFDWAISANEKIRNYIIDGNHQPLIDFKNQGRDFQLSIPTPEHYLPLLYVLGLREKDEKATIFNDQLIGGSLNMMSVKIDKT